MRRLGDVVTGQFHIGCVICRSHWALRPTRISGSLSFLNAARMASLCTSVTIEDMNTGHCRPEAHTRKSQRMRQTNRLSLSKEPPDTAQPQPCKQVHQGRIRGSASAKTPSRDPLSRPWIRRALDMLRLESSFPAPQLDTGRQCTSDARHKTMQTLPS